MYNADKPITKSSEDSLKRTSFSKKLAKAILSYNSTENFTISLTGKWGCGKSSILNMVKEEIEVLAMQISDEYRPIIVEFNPWNYSNQNQLISQFFESIRTSMHKTDSSKTLQTIGEALQEYSTSIESAAFIPVVGKYASIISFVQKIAGKKISDAGKKIGHIDAQKKNLTKMLGKLNAKIIIIVDDIDRLNNEQIRLIFQLVNSVAGFPNMIYLLSFDKTVVARALEKEQNCNGEEYLEKIIQVPFEVPPVSKTDLLGVFTKRLNLILNDIPYDRNNYNEDYWSDVLTYCISPFVNSIRDTNRILNVYRFKYGLLKEEVNYIDLLAITTLQVCAPKLYEWILINKTLLTDNTGNITPILEGDRNIYKEKYLSEFKELYPDNSSEIFAAIEVLFPVFHSLTSASNYSFYAYTNIDSSDELRRHQKIASPERFDLYFNLSLEKIKFTKSYMGNTIHAMEPQTLSSELDKLMSDGTLSDYLLEFQGYVKEIINERLFIFFQEMIRLQTIPSFARISNGHLVISHKSICYRVALLILENIPNTLRYEHLLISISKSNYKSLPILAKIMIAVESSIGKNETVPVLNDVLFDNEQIEKLEQRILNKMKAVYSEKNLLDSHDFTKIFQLWNFLDKESLFLNIKEQLKKPVNIPKILFHLVTHWNSSSGKLGWTFREDNFSAFITKEDAYKTICDLKGTVDFNELQFNFQKTAISYYLWYNLNGKDHTEITDKKVNSLLPEWIK
ncbi:KAP family P-loop domain protein [anaerobic digester metagenome]